VTTTATPARLPWLDSARGMAILLVVFHHTILYTGAVGVAHPVWVYLNGALNTFRMPLFFFVSGLLAARAVRRDWRTLLRGRVALLVWVYVVWSLTAGTWFRVIPNLRSVGGRSWASLPWSILTATTSIWYLCALAIFLVIARAVRGVPTWPILAVTGAISLVFGADLVVPSSWAWQSMAMYAVFFFAGNRLHAPVLAWAQSPVGWPLAVGALAGYVVLTGACFAAFGSDVLSTPGVRPLLSSAAVAAGCLVARWAATVRVGRGLTAVGRLTLPFYVMHGMIVGALALAFLPFADGVLREPLALVAPLLVAVVGIALTAVLRPAVERIPGALSLPRAFGPPAAAPSPPERALP